MPERDAEVEMDLSGLICPLPVLKARKRLESMARGEILKVIATDPMSAIDMPHFCTEQGHALLSQERQGAAYVFRIARRISG
jgi:tRNA 2-thiouridine synthesizing protein A